MAASVDEVYRFASKHNPGGAVVLDYLLVRMGNRIEYLVFLLAGYTKPMEKFFEHNPGLPSRVPYKPEFTTTKTTGFSCLNNRSRTDSILDRHSTVHSLRPAQNRGPHASLMKRHRSEHWASWWSIGKGPLFLTRRLPLTVSQTSFLDHKALRQ